MISNLYLSSFIGWSWHTKMRIFTLRASSQSNSYSCCKIPKTDIIQQKGHKKYIFIYICACIFCLIKKIYIYILFSLVQKLLFSSLGDQKIKRGGGFHVSEFPSIKVSKFPSFQGRREGGMEWGRKGGPMRGLWTDHVISGPMRGL